MHAIQTRIENNHSSEYFINAAVTQKKGKKKSHALFSFSRRLCVCVDVDENVFWSVSMAALEHRGHAKMGWGERARSNELESRNAAFKQNREIMIVRECQTLRRNE